MARQLKERVCLCSNVLWVPSFEGTTVSQFAEIVTVRANPSSIP
jgi:hypothetical protein